MKLQERCKALRNEDLAVRDAMAAEIMSLPQNPKINKSSVGFTISASEIFLNNCILTPSYYDFDSQKSELRREIYSSASVEQAIARLQKICKTSCSMDQSIRFHPFVIGQVKKLLDS